MLETTFYLILKSDGRYRLSVRAMKKRPALKADEVPVQCTVQVPEALFKRPSLTAKITVPENQVRKPTIKAAVVDNIKETLERELGLDLTIALVEDEE